MSFFDGELLLIACVTTMACIIPGTFLVVRGVALMADAISHAVLLGIVVLFLYVQDLHSPVLMLGAALAGTFTAVVTESLVATRCLKKDAAIGLVYPFLFSVGVILISVYARNAHLDLDMIFLGDLTYAPYNRCYFLGIDCGPWALFSMNAILIFNIVSVGLFYKELVVSIFDPTFARLVGICPAFYYYALMFLTSITAVGAFDVVGAVVVIALMVVPPATALLVTKHFPSVIAVGMIVGMVSSLAGYMAAAYWDLSIAGTIATMQGVCFLVVFVLYLKK